MIKYEMYFLKSKNSVICSFIHGSKKIIYQMIVQVLKEAHASVLGGWRDTSRRLFMKMQ